MDGFYSVGANLGLRKRGLPTVQPLQQLFIIFLKALLLRYHFIKSTLPVGRFHNQICKETIQLLTYIYI